MGTIKILGFDEDGNAQRLKIRIARFLDYDPVTASDKSNIRSTLGITSQGGLGDLLAANNLDDVASLDTTKANLEIPDVGTGPSQVPLNQHLGTMAYQDIAGVSVAELQGDNIGLNASPTDARLTITDSTNDCIHLTADESTIQGPYADTQIRMGGNIVVKGVNNAFLTTGSNTGLAVDSSGNVGIGGSTVASTRLAVEGNTRVRSASVGGDALLYLNNHNYQGWVGLSSGNRLQLATDNTVRWEISNAGHLIASSGVGIDFGSGSTGSGNTVQSGLLDDFEEGSFDVAMGADSGTITLNPSWATLFYVKIGRLVYISGELVVSSVSTPTGNVFITGLPFLVNASITRSSLTCYTRGLASDIGSTVAFANPNSTNVYIRESGTTSIGHLIANNWQAGTEMIIGGCYHTS